MKLKYHSENLAKRWLKMSICEQLGNVGSEIGRAVKWLNKGKNDLMKNCLGRAFELLNLTIVDPRWQNHRQTELKMAREVLADAFYGQGEYKTTPEEMEKYFYQYALAARLNK